MKKLLLSILALCALSMVSTHISAKAEKGAMEGTTTVRCGHCRSHLEHKDAKCHTHGCPGATVICEKPVTVMEEEKRACETTCTYRCPEGTEQQGEAGPNMRCVTRKVTEKCHAPIKDTVIDCKQACPAGTTMKPGSERDNAHPKNHDRVEKSARRAKNTVTREM